MNKKIVIICSVLAVLLLGVIGFAFYKLYFSTNGESGQVVDNRSDALSAVPADAIFVYDFATLEDAPFGLEGDSDGEFMKVFKLCRESLPKCGAAVSLHYSAKNTVSLLLVVSLEDDKNKGIAKEFLDDSCSGVINKKYGNTIISKAVIPQVSYAFYNNFLVASTSHVVVESSIRHLESKSSIVDNDLYSKTEKRLSGTKILHINHQNLGKLFSGVVNYDYLKHANFFSSFYSWSGYSLDFSENLAVAEGQAINVKDEGNFSNVFSLQKAKVPTVYEILPHNTDYVITTQISHSEGYLDSYVGYLEAVKKINDYNYLNTIVSKRDGMKMSPREWFLELDVDEIAVASVPAGDKSEKVVLMKMKETEKMALYGDYIHTLLGNMYKPASQEAFSVIDQWVVVGSEKLVNKMATQYQNELYFSLEMYLEQTPAAHLLKESANLAGVVNLSRCVDTLSAVFKQKYSEVFVDEIKDNNFNLLYVKLDRDGDVLNPSVSLYMENLDLLPQPPVSEIASSGEAVYDETVVDVSKGPFQIKNFVNGKENYIQQMDDHKIRLLDHNKKGVWTIPFDGELCGYVEQVDHYKNNKLQMLFCSGSKMYMLDRLGRWVRSYPVDLGKEVLLGPKVYDFEGVKDYTIVVLHKDNTIGMYDIKGAPDPSWSPVSISEKIRSLPELLDVNGDRYWVIRTGYQAIICNENGTPVSEFSKKKRLKVDTQIEVVSANEVVVTNIEGKEMVLNLQTGVMKKR